MIEKFDVSRFVVCTDAGLSSAANRHFNDYDKEDGCRSFITTQSIKKLKEHPKKWALDPQGWSLSGDTSGRIYDIQQLVVSYSIKYRDYLRTIRNSQIERAQEMVAGDGTAALKKRQNAPKRFIKTDYATSDGEAADKAASYIDQRIIDAEEQFDGFYAVCTNLEDKPETIVKVNKCRWEIEECFRIMKTDFEARPVYVKRQDRILAHFMTCFIALIVYRYLEQKLGEKYTIDQILSTLREMDFMKYEGKGYQPVYTRTELTDALHEAFGFCTSRQIIPVSKMKNI